MYTKADRYDPGSPFKAWLYRIATNVGIDMVRKRKRRRWVGLGEALFKVKGPETEAEPGALSDEPPASSRGALGDLLAAERGRLVRAAIRSLPPKYRNAVVLRDLQELSYQEIARALDCRIGTVKSRVNRARNLLREKLAAHAGPAAKNSHTGEAR